MRIAFIDQRPTFPHFLTLCLYMASSNVSNLDQEYEDLTRRREEELRTFSDQYGRFVKGRNEMQQRTRQTPLEPEDAGLRCVICVPLISSKGPSMLGGMNVTLKSTHLNGFSRSYEPRLQVRITGPPTVSLSSKTLSISARLTYMSSQDSQALTLQSGSVNGTSWNEGEAYLFYDEQGRVPEYEFLEKEYDDEPRLVRPENGFVTLETGETVERSVEIWLSWWQDNLQLGREYGLRMPWAHVAWWNYGTMDVSIPEGVDCKA